MYNEKITYTGTKYNKLYVQTKSYLNIPQFPKSLHKHAMSTLINRGPIKNMQKFIIGPVNITCAKILDLGLGDIARSDTRGQHTHTHTEDQNELPTLKKT